MALINSTIYTELEKLTNKIESNTAKLKDYERYELLLTNAGLPREYIYSYLRRAGFNDWEDFYEARLIQESRKKENDESLVVGGLIGLGLGILISSMFSDDD